MTHSSGSADYHFLINQIANGLANTTDLIKGLSAEIKDNTISLATLRTELKAVTKNVEDLSRILKDGNGTAPLITRVSLLENNVGEIKENLEETERELRAARELLQSIKDKQQTSIEERKIDIESRKGKLQIVVAMITGIVGLIASIVGALMG